MLRIAKSMEGSVKKSRIYFPHLDVIRGIAAFMIIIIHSYEEALNFLERPDIFIDSEGKLNLIGQWSEQFIFNLGLGVDIFFLISGFLITYILLVEREQNGKISIWNFIMRRTLRIWPLYFLLIAVAPVLVMIQARVHPNYLMNALFLGNFDIIRTSVFEWPFAHFWTICVEEHFYIFWPFIIAFVPRRYLLSSIFVVIASSMLYRFYVSAYVENHGLYLYLHTLSRIDVLAIGAIGGYFYWKKPFKSSLPRWIRYLVLIAFVYTLCNDEVILWQTPFEAVFRKYIYVFLLIIFLIDYNFNSTYVHMLKPGSIIHYFGKISYGIYMYGNIIIHLVSTRIFIKYGLENIFLYHLIILVITVIVASLSFELFEKPILKLKRKFSAIKTSH